MTYRILTDARTVQSYLKKYASGLVVDGDIGPKTINVGRSLLSNRKLLLKPLLEKSPLGSAATSYLPTWSDQRVLTAVEQTLISTKAKNLILADGLIGPVTQGALEVFQNANRDVNSKVETIFNTDKAQQWPRQKDMVAFYGKPADESNLVFLNTPYPLYLDWDLKTKVTRFKIHKKVKASAESAMNAILNHYGEVEIHRLGLDQFGGCYNPRKMVGGSSWSMHAWGVAIDWDADRNPLRSNNTNARFATVPECKFFLDAWEAEGWTSLGRARNFDWMHVQAARL